MSSPAIAFSMCWSSKAIFKRTVFLSLASATLRDGKSCDLFIPETNITEHSRIPMARLMRPKGYGSPSNTSLKEISTSLRLDAEYLLYEDPGSNDTTSRGLKLVTWIEGPGSFTNNSTISVGPGAGKVASRSVNSYTITNILSPGGNGALTNTPFSVNITSSGGNSPLITSGFLNPSGRG